MTKQDVIDIMKKNNIPQNTVSFQGSNLDRLVYYENKGMWEVFYSERGQRIEEHWFATESEACECLLECLKKDGYLID